MATSGMMMKDTVNTDAAGMALGAGAYVCMYVCMCVCVFVFMYGHVCACMSV
jgi:hypothetical protein